jgi:hypothetical protein
MVQMRKVVSSDHTLPILASIVNVSPQSFAGGPATRFNTPAKMSQYIPNIPPTSLVASPVTYAINLAVLQFTVAPLHSTTSSFLQSSPQSLLPTFKMRFSTFFALPALLSMMCLTTAHTVPLHARQIQLPDQTFTCPGTQSVSLCCSSGIKTTGGAEDCEKSLHFLIRAADDHSYLTNSIHTCSTEQLSRGYNRPVCCRSMFQPTVNMPRHASVRDIANIIDRPKPSLMRD